MHIPKWLIATAGLLVVVLIAAVAFLVGRQTAPPPEAPTAVADTTQEPASVKDPAPITPSSSAFPSTTSASAADTSQVSAEARARVSAYFEQMDRLQSAAPGGDQEAFAKTILQGALSGDFSGIDDLVRSAGDAERRAVALQPPSECAEYHRMAVTLLQESRTMIIALRDGLKRNDADALTSIGATAQSMKSRADALAAAEKTLRARFGL